MEVCDPDAADVKGRGYKLRSGQAQQKLILRQAQDSTTAKNIIITFPS